MTRLLSSILILGALGGGALYVHQITRDAPANPLRHEVVVPTIEQVRQLGSLVTLDVPISKIAIEQVAGHTGGQKMTAAIYGDVLLSTDLERAEFADLDAERRSAILILPRPVPGRPRIDHERTQILSIERTGLWKVPLLQTSEQVLTNRLHRLSQRTLRDLADQPELVAQACGHAERVLREFFDALGWTVAIQWDDAPATA